MLSINALLLYSYIASTAQVVFSGAFNFSDVQECQPFTISFQKDLDATTLPTTLSILPFNSRPLYIDIPNASTNLTGVFVTFLPLPAGSTFITSLDSASGESLAKVSDVIRVLPASNGTTDCLSSINSTKIRNLFKIEGEPSQCQELTVHYNTSVVSSAPPVRLYNPKGKSFFLNQTSDNPSNGTAKYIVNFQRGKEVVFMIGNEDADREVSSLLTVGGDTSSSSDCIAKDSGSGTADTMTSAMSDAPSPIPKALIIGSAIGGGVVVIIAICMVIFLVRERRRRRRNQSANDRRPSLLEKGLKNVQNYTAMPETLESPQVAPNTSNPPYTLFSPQHSSNLRNSLASWSQFVPSDQVHPGSDRTPEKQNYSHSLDRLSISSLDIEGMLDLAVAQSQQVSEKHLDSPSSYNTGVETVIARPQGAIARPFLSRRHLRDPSDVPLDPTSFTLSGYSLNPFSDEQIILETPTIEYIPRSASSTPVQSPRNAGGGLPSQNRAASPLRNDEMSAARSSKGSTGGDWYVMAK